MIPMNLMWIADLVFFFPQGEVKKACLEWMKGDERNGIPPRSIPSVEDMRRVVMREIEDEDKEKEAYLFDLFVWYVDNLLPHCANVTIFGEKIRRQQCVSTAKWSDNPNKLAVTPSTEAMVFLLFDHNHDKWIEFHKWREVEKNVGNMPKYVKKDAKTHRFQTKYSEGAPTGWPFNEEGVSVFYNMCEAIKKNRKENAADIKQVEEKCIQRLLEDLARKTGKNIAEVVAEKEAKVVKPLPTISRKRYRDDED